ENNEDTGDQNNEDTGDQNNEDTGDQNNEDHIAGNQTHAQQNAQEKISELQQRIDDLEQRLQSLLAMFESGKYFGTTFGVEQPTSYDLSFDGTATSIDGSTTDNMTGEIFFDSLVTGDEVSKFRVTGGVVSIGNNDYDLIFGKARVTTLDATDSMVLIAQAVDDQGNAHTLKILLDSTPLDGLGSEPVDVSIKTPQSKIAGQWTLSATGQLSVV
ncbi:MAG: hypothetical protein HZA82_01480, partial [Thaumarchaeota archaeon]|nr:hypothetical protein [Nitrososphaerota archaeon]